MDSYLICDAAAILVTFILFLYSFGKTLSYPNLPLPPGPRALPIIGNAHQLFSAPAQEAFAHLAQKWGDIVYLRIFKTSMIVVSSAHIARELTEMNSGNTSDRPRFVLFRELMDMTNDVVLMPYGDKWRRHRRWLLDVIQNTKDIIDVSTMQQIQTARLLKGFVGSPDTFLTHIKLWSAAMMMKLAYGFDVTTLKDEYIELIEEALKATTGSAGPASTLVDLFPPLRHIPEWVPGAGFKRRALAMKEIRRRMQASPYRRVKQAMRSGSVPPSVTSRLLQSASEELDEATEWDIQGIATVLYTESESTLTAFIQAMVMFPEVYAKAQQEIDEVIGRDRLPEFADRESLPYLECVLKELYRWSCPAPLGVPHRLIGDCQYNQFRLPGGSTLMFDLWAMTRDTATYPRPEDFLPERFQSGPENEEPPEDPRGIVFGFGRRICPGRHLVDNSLWLAIVTITATLSISRAVDADGKEIMPVLAFPSSAVRHYEDFQCVIRPRSQAIVDIVMQMDSEQV
ncbi:hypothetical protein IEO21_08930 [Rhodonia placenta]|uniref:Cytochrome P450 n=1 Tax=Rhodonia placenta TaxID=104341 RepID=A0A8H7TYW9_9APHY|nr:hypothetical protein IEO21_08930 [Postia placenta]